MSRYQSFIDLAERLINRNGREIELVLASKETPNPERPWEIEKGRQESKTIKAVEVALETKFVDGTNIRQTDKQLLVATKNLGTEIQPHHFLIDKGYTFRILKPMKLQPGDECILYTLIVR